MNFKKIFLVNYLREGVIEKVVKCKWQYWLDFYRSFEVVIKCGRNDLRIGIVVGEFRISLGNIKLLFF